jgi:branched-chain amino acid transport system permease protein
MAVNREQPAPSLRTQIPASRLVWIAGASIGLVVLALLPHVVNLYWIRVLTNVFMFTVLAQSINIIAGFVGYPAFGNVVFFGLGAYGMGVMVVQFQASAVIGMLVGLLLCAAVVLIVGPPLLRLRGHYFAIATLGLNEAIKAVISNLTDLTGGGKGLSLPLPNATVQQSALQFYWMFLTLAGIGILVAVVLRSSRFGYACRAIRANEDGAESLGINTTYYKTAAWLISALLAGSGGALYAQWIAYIEPPAVFDMTIAVKAFVMFLLGGAGTIFGPAIGAALVELLTTITWSHLLSYHLGVLGIIIMAAAVLMPNGIQVFIRDRMAAISHLFAAKR